MQTLRACLYLSFLISLHSNASIPNKNQYVNSEYTPDCSKEPNVLPHPDRPKGTSNRANPIEHIVVVTQENHSFDNYLGQLSKPQFYGDSVDGISANFSNLNREGRKIKPYHEKNYCLPDPKHDWTSMHVGWNEGKNNLFAALSGDSAMGYYDETDLPNLYLLANTFAIGDRYFSSVLGPTFPNRYFLMAGTSFGQVGNSITEVILGLHQNSIFHQLTKAGISWKYYSNGKVLMMAFRQNLLMFTNHLASVLDYEVDLIKGNLPQVVFIDPNGEEESEHPNDVSDSHTKTSILTGQTWVSARIFSLMRSSYWKNSIIFLTYDENGGFADHVSPPKACQPDSKKPKLGLADSKGDFDRLGLRVPFLAISPYVKHHFVSHEVYDHGSILRFIEEKFNLPYLTRRDANANDLSNLFDFEHPDFSYPILFYDKRTSCEP